MGAAVGGQSAGLTRNRSICGKFTRRSPHTQSAGPLELPSQLAGFAVRDDKLTAHGGAVAIGHPLGASGTRYVPDPGDRTALRQRAVRRRRSLHRVRASRGRRRGIRGRAGSFRSGAGWDSGALALTEPIVLRGLNTALHLGSILERVRGASRSRRRFWLARRHRQPVHRFDQIIDRDLRGDPHLIW